MQIELTQEQEQQIIPAALYFLRALTSTLGSDVGMEVWNQINATMGNDIKGKVFFAMMTGQVGTEIIIRGLKLKTIGQARPDKIDIIKCIRAISGMSLKSAKDVADDVFMGIEKRIICVQFEQRDHWLRQLWALGVEAL